ncbi:hypothetical protein [Falsiroseomonas sp. E2-1-a20]|uniref:hypothetical protein n=1 Tax=Falsiroseomonas sp. E2-1-a20 TaxID=3239300 RepID=UPI003F34A5E8
MGLVAALTEDLSVRYDRAKQLREELAADITDLTARAEAQPNPQALPAEIAKSVRVQVRRLQRGACHTDRVLAARLRPLVHLHGAE